MKVISDKFDSIKHKETLVEFYNYLLEKQIPINAPIKRIEIYPESIAGITELLHIKHKTMLNAYTGNILQIVIKIGVSKIKVFCEDNTSSELETGIKTPKGYKQKSDFDEFIFLDVNQNLHLTTDSINIIKPFIHRFKVWKD